MYCKFKGPVVYYVQSTLAKRQNLEDIHMYGIVKGRRIRFTAPAGIPEQAADTEDVILEVHGNSALTVAGVRLSQCNGDWSKIEPLEDIVENPQPSAAAQKVLDEVASRFQ